ncbi:MAG: PAS domain-containing protein [Magnetospirillum sp.]|nr:PAS domain-containing protein [Magnetospirillum sp.]
MNSPFGYDNVGQPPFEASLDRLERCPDGFMSLDDSLRLRYANAAAVDILRLAQPSCVGQSIEDLIGHDDSNPMARHLRNALAGSKAANFEGKFGERWIDVRIHPVADGLDVFLKDVTERALLEASLKEEEERRRLVEQRFETALSVNPMVVFNLDKNLRYTWVYNNQIRLNDEAARGRGPSDFFDAETVPAILNFFRSVIETGKPARAELSLRPISMGEIRHYISSAKPMFSDDGDVVGLTGASIDVTEIVRQRQELERARKDALLAKAEAERANLSKSKFLAAASHDLRQPVQSLFLLLAAMESRLAGTEFADVVEKIGVALDALRLLLDSMLDISRIDAGIIVPKFDCVALDPVLSRLAREYRLRAQEKKLDLRYVKTSLCVRSDASLIERALRNLIENAIRYTVRGRILIGCRRYPGMVQIDVADTGIGIAAEHRETVFDEFQQVDNCARDRAQGLGLGLTIVRRLARLLGGEVELDSAVAKGSRFSLLLPAAPDVDSHRRPSCRSVSGAGQRILLIEDDAMLSDSLDMLLRHWCFTTSAAATGDAALDIVRRGFRPTLIIADYRLKGKMNGIEAVRRIEGALGESVPALIITGDTAPERIGEALCGGLRILHKPIAAEDLRRELVQMIRTEDTAMVNRHFRGDETS